jgi:hypothetical protein
MCYILLAFTVLLVKLCISCGIVLLFGLNFCVNLSELQGFFCVEMYRKPVCHAIKQLTHTNKVVPIHHVFYVGFYLRLKCLQALTDT